MYQEEKAELINSKIKIETSYWLVYHSLHKITFYLGSDLQLPLNIFLLTH